MTTNNQKGFSAVILLLSLLLVVAVGFTGYYVWNQKNNKTAQEATQVAGQQEAKKAETTPKTETKPADTQKYLVIKEWGVKIPLDENTKDAIYGPVSGTQDYFGLSNESINAANGGVECRIFSISRKSAPLNTEEVASPPVYLKKLGKYYYYGIPSQAECGENKTQEQGLAWNSYMELTKMISEQ